MRLKWEEIVAINWSEWSWEDIECLMDLGCITDDDMSFYFGNEWWKDKV